jgi:hypothetical protein
LNRHCATHRQLKEQLLTEIATLFDQGEMWEKAIETLKQLMPVYETMLFEYDKLAILLVSADLFMFASSQKYLNLHISTTTHFRYNMYTFVGSHCCIISKNWHAESR